MKTKNDLREADRAGAGSLSRRLFLTAAGASLLALPAATATAKAQAEPLAAGSLLTASAGDESTARAALEARIAELEGILDAFVGYHVYDTTNIAGFQMPSHVDACLVFDHADDALYWAERE